jgi:penicillin-binding protein 2
VIKDFKPIIAGKVDVKQSTWDLLKRSLRAVVTRGTGAGAFAGLPVEVSGKTGTAQVFGRNLNGSAKDDTSWFASYGPTANPQYAVVMMVSQGGFGASTSGIGVREIYQTLLAPGNEIFPSGVPSGIPKVDFKAVAKVKIEIEDVKATPKPKKSAGN